MQHLWFVLYGLKRNNQNNYYMPQVAVILGQLLGRYLNDWVMIQEIRRNNGVFEAEARLW